MWLGHKNLSGYAQYRAATFQRLINNIVCDFEVRYAVDPKFCLFFCAQAPRDNTRRQQFCISQYDLGYVAKRAVWCGWGFLTRKTVRGVLLDFY